MVSNGPMATKDPINVVKMQRLWRQGNGLGNLASLPCLVSGKSVVFTWFFPQFVQVLPRLVEAGRSHRSPAPTNPVWCESERSGFP